MLFFKEALLWITGVMAKERELYRRGTRRYID